MLYYLIFCVFASCVVNCVTQNQVKRSFIRRGVALSSAALDLLIFVGALWETAVLIKLKRHNYENTAFFIAEACLCGVTYLRVGNVVLMILYIFCVLPWYCAPDFCPCTRCLKGEDLDPAVYDLLNKNAWVFDRSALEDQEQRVACFICLTAFKNSDELMMLPCGVNNRKYPRQALGSYESSMNGSIAQTLKGSTYNSQRPSDSAGSLINSHDDFAPLVRNETNFETDYSHNFHTDCLVQWLQTHQECPICRETVKADMFTAEAIMGQARAGFVGAIALDNTVVE